MGKAHDERSRVVIYVNGDSYSLSNGKNYGNYLSEIYNQKLIHRGITGSSNTRIFRTTTRDLLKLKADGIQDVKVILGLTFNFRTELWIEDHNIEKWYKHQFDDGEFASFQSISNKDWWKSGPIVTPRGGYLQVPKFYQNYLKEWVICNHSDGLTVNTIYQASLLKNLCENLGYKFIIFWAADNTKDTNRMDSDLDSLKDFYAEFNETNSINLLKFSFVKHYFDLGHKPYDYDLFKEHGHPNTLVHELFAQRLYNIFEELNKEKEYK